jgi:hypothetical protein
MVGPGEAIGELANGALIALAVEPKAGSAAGNDAGHTHETACLNCGTALIGTHCHACGQHSHVHKTLAAFFHDLAHGVFHFEGKVWRTLPLLIWRPGRLTREYIDGRRASYVSPIALFLFVTFLGFALFGLIGSMPSFDGAGEVAKRATGSASAGIAATEAKLDAKLADLKKQRDADVAAHRSTDEVNEEIDGVQTALATVADSAKQQAAGKPDSDLPHVVATSQSDRGKRIAERLNVAFGRARKDPELAMFKLEANAHKYTWLLIPLSVPFVWLLFPFSRRFKVYDHTIFVTYSLSFMCLLLTVIALAMQLPSTGLLVGLLTLYAPFHMYRQLRDTYALSRRSALVRAALLGMFAFWVILFWIVTLVGLIAVE